MEKNQCSPFNLLTLFPYNYKPLISRSAQS